MNPITVMFEWVSIFSYKMLRVYHSTIYALFFSFRYPYWMSQRHKI
jgi:hypothetical protein